MAPNVDAASQAFSRAALYTDNVVYLLVHLPAPAITASAGVLAEIGTPFSALIADKDEVTLVVPKEHWDSFAHRLPEHRLGGDYRLITFDLPLDFDLVGFMALVSTILAEAFVSILPLASFERDHILVSVAQFQAAWDALGQAQARLGGR
ncbi:MAG: ACT domain-containing protein [Anaerolineae bacterium]|nr:ACT domain-containing protein [Anaerolineae bacterium]